MTVAPEASPPAPLVIIRGGGVLACAIYEKQATIASGPDDKHPVKGTVLLQAQSDSIAQKVTSVEVLFTPGTEEANGSVTAPVVGTEMRARTLCINNTDCTDAFNYQWEISDEMKSWQSVPGATKATWLIPYSLNGESLQNKYIRVRIISDKENAKSSTAASDAN